MTMQDAARLILTCTVDGCGAEAEYEGIVRTSVRKTSVSLLCHYFITVCVKGSSFVCGLLCPACSAPYNTSAVQNRLTLLMREHIGRYYEVLEFVSLV